ncbi:MAG: hypothetical protein LBE72_03665 [Rickettsia sp.]|jgi:hypothetical protein|nr:hypothetical protein [Rickettsia sp.]
MSIYQTEYTFKLIKSTKEENDTRISKKLVISAYSRLLNNTNFYFIIRCNYKEHRDFIIDSISLVDDHRFSHEEQKKIYLMGVLDLGAIYCVDAAINELKEELNGAKVNDKRIYSQRWDTFSSQLQGWYNTKLIPLLQKEVELTKSYFME